MKEILDVLLVEDNEDHAFLIKSVLDEKFHVQVLHDGLQALDHLLCCKKKPDVVVIDYLLPLLNGLEVIKETKKKGKEYAFIFLTVDTSVDIVIDAMKAGALDFLPKYKGYSSLVEMIEKVDKIFTAQTNYKKAEKALKESEKRLNSILNASYVKEYHFIIAIIFDKTESSC